MDFLAERVPVFSCHMPEGTYLAWMDGRRAGLSPGELTAFLHGDARFAPATAIASSPRSFGKGRNPERVT